jgi:hypothetical protein
MRRAITIFLAVAAVPVLFSGCEALLALLGDPPATPLEQVEGFLAAASATPQDPLTLRAYFDPQAADYGSMQLESYWLFRFFKVDEGPYALLNGAEGDPDPAFADSVTVTGNVTNDFNDDPGYAAVFVLTTDPDDLLADPLIRKITVTVGETDLIIEKVISLYR